MDSLLLCAFALFRKTEKSKIITKKCFIRSAEGAWDEKQDNTYTWGLEQNQSLSQLPIFHPRLLMILGNGQNTRLF